MQKRFPWPASETIHAFCPNSRGIFQFLNTCHAKRLSEVNSDKKKKKWKGCGKYKCYVISLELDKSGSSSCQKQLWGEYHYTEDRRKKIHLLFLNILP